MHSKIFKKKQGLANSVIVSQQSAENTPALHLQDNRPSSLIQKKQVEAMANGSPVQRQPNNTGLPDQLKSGVESLSGYSMDDVKVHYNSDKPAQLNAHAYAQGTDIHIASGQEKHLPHEAWHVVQQKQGRVKPTMQMKGKVNVNDDKGLEKEADVMGAKAFGIRNQAQQNQNEQRSTGHSQIASTTTQRLIKIGDEVDSKDPKFRAAMTKFQSVLTSDSELGWIAGSKNVELTLQYVEGDLSFRGKTDIEIRGNGHTKTGWESLGSGDLGTLRGLLTKGTPKRVKITIWLNGAVMHDKSEVECARVLAHEVGVHVAPYAPLLKQAVGEAGVYSGLGKREISLLEYAHGSKHEETDHKNMHQGYLNMDLGIGGYKPRFRELVDALAKSQYTSEAQIKELWVSYVENVGRYDTDTGKILRPGKKLTAQQQFYEDIEGIKGGRKHRYSRPLLYLNNKKKVGFATLIILLFIGYMIYYSLFSSQKLMDKSSEL